MGTEHLQRGAGGRGPAPGSARLMHPGVAQPAPLAPQLRAHRPSDHRGSGQQGRAGRYCRGRALRLGGYRQAAAAESTPDGTVTFPKVCGAQLVVDLEVGEVEALRVAVRVHDLHPEVHLPRRRRGPAPCPDISEEQRQRHRARRLRGHRQVGDDAAVAGTGAPARCTAARRWWSCRPGYRPVVGPSSRSRSSTRVRIRHRSRCRRRCSKCTRCNAARWPRTAPT